MGVVSIIAGLACVFVAVRSQEWMMTRDRRELRGLEPRSGLGRVLGRGFAVGLVIYAFGGAGLLLIGLGIASFTAA